MAKLNVKKTRAVAVSITRGVLRQKRRITILCLANSGLRRRHVGLRVRVVNLRVGGSPVKFLETLGRTHVCMGVFSPGMIRTRVFRTGLFYHVLHLFAQVPFLVYARRGEGVRKTVHVGLCELASYLSSVGAGISRRTAGCFVSGGSFGGRGSGAVCGNISLSGFVGSSGIQGTVQGRCKVLRRSFLFVGMKHLAGTGGRRALIGTFFRLGGGNLRIGLLVMNGKPRRRGLGGVMDDFSLGSSYVFANVRGGVISCCGTTSYFILSSL